MILNETYTLNNGYKIPKIAFGTWQIDNAAVTDAVKTAFSLGYRHIDTASAYGNESGIGKAIAESGLSREDIFITTKIPAEIKNYDDAREIINESLKNLNTSYIDLMLIHAPKPWEELFSGSDKNYYEENLAVWNAMEEAVKIGLIRSIGVSNFEIADIQNLLEHGKIKPAANQIRVHIGHTPTDVITYCQTNNITVMAFSPNATGKLLVKSYFSLSKDLQLLLPESYPPLCTDGVKGLSNEDTFAAETHKSTARNCKIMQYAAQAINGDIAIDPRSRPPA